MGTSIKIVQALAASASAEYVEQAIGNMSWALVPMDQIRLIPSDAQLFPSPVDLCLGLVKKQGGNETSLHYAACIDAAREVVESPLRCVIVGQSGETVVPIGAEQVPTFWSVMERVDCGLAIAVLAAVCLLTYFRIGVKHQPNQYRNNFFYLVVMAIIIYFTTPNTGFFSPNSIMTIVQESYRAFTIVHTMSSPWISLSHFATYWFKVAAWRSKSLRNMLFWQLLVEIVSAPVNEYAHHTEELNEIRCMRMAFINSAKHYAFDDMIRVYVLSPFFVYGYLLPKFLYHWIFAYLQQV